jgi:hypothetical protein
LEREEEAIEVNDDRLALPRRLRAQFSNRMMQRPWDLPFTEMGIGLVAKHLVVHAIALEGATTGKPL